MQQNSTPLKTIPRIIDVIALLDRLMIIQDEKQILGEDDTGFFTDTPKYDKPGFEDFTKIMDEIRIMLSELFVVMDGDPDYNRMKILNNLSAGKYQIVCGLRDSFGWVCSDLVTPRGKITF